MNDINKIRMVVARFFDVPEATVTDSFLFPVQRLQGSVGRATLRAAIKRLAGANLPAAMSATTFGQLINPATPTPAASVETKSPASATASQPTARRDAPAIGIDIELCDNLTWSGDPWTEPFYIENFTPAEIGYCMRQTNPKESFCGLWSAKEAAIKCGPPFSELRPLQIEIVHDANGKPALHPSLAKDSAVSISHSGQIAVGVCVLMPVRRS